ncbi:hypothetical protein SAMN05660462_02196 [Proteiniborus ethanoligenes]|uniref:YqzL-like protein n=1 Tax=Proteiniborus ethanoligenes TaxID=415015 RepID=A0A1H3R369_9FIRM|nr:YqzL family protein [Proteiniborus ethanoligenes]TAH63321.1 MAG: YqzL family protein [Gottschalkiaceae bacterium]SDZ20070.1 hypothetical protein SAMN05660462_02196 [Proteiniborus ethanoligenes]
MLMNEMWQIFETTGNINAYLCYRDYSILFNKNSEEICSVTKDEKRA